jgi:hypothetical protein
VTRFNALIHRAFRPGSLRAFAARFPSRLGDGGSKPKKTTSGCFRPAMD